MRTGISSPKEEELELVLFLLREKGWNHFFSARRIGTSSC
jgi:hypothetical protein